MRPRTVKVRIPPGVDDGQIIRLPGRGEPGHNGGPAGDLYVTVDVDPHPEFGRIGNNLTLTVPVTYPEATLGAKVTVPTLDGSTVTVRVPAGTPPGRTLRVAGKGVPRPGRHGDLLLTIDLDIPRDLTAAERDLIEQLRDAGGHRRPRAMWEDRS
jgi:molecular chaperone DnaJ